MTNDSRLPAENARDSGPGSAADAAACRLGHRPWLDGVRGLALLAVLFTHFHIITGGAIAMDVFFVLSGFLITTMLAEEYQRNGSISLKNFYMRRILRLFPAFAVLLLVFAIATILWTPPEHRADRWMEMVAAGCYIMNWHHYHGIQPSMLGHTWSLSLEEQFYLLWPILLVTLLWFKVSKKRILWIIVTGIVLSCLWRAWLHNEHRVLGGERIDRMRLYIGLDTRADALLMGCLIGLLFTWGMLPRSERIIAWLKPLSLAALGVVAFCFFKRDHCSSQYYDGLYTVLAFAIAILFVRMLVAPSPLCRAVLEWRPFLIAGKISYGAYLFHIPLLAWLESPDMGWNDLNNVALLFAASIAAGCASHYLVERPFLRLKDRFNAPTAAPPREAPLKLAA